MCNDQQIVDQTNDLARLCLSYIGTGYEVPDDHKFYEAEDPRSRKAWQMACEIQQQMTATDPNDALSNITEPEVETKEYTIRIGVTVRAFASENFEAASWEEAVEKAKAYQPADFLYRYAHDDVEGDEIGYLREADDYESDEHEIDLRKEGEPFSWFASEIVKELAALNAHRLAHPEQIIADKAIALMEKATAACAKED